MNDNITKALLEKYLAGDCTPEEKVRIERAYNLSIPDRAPEISEQRYTEMSNQVWAHVESQQQAGKTIRLWPRIAMAAAAVTAITLGIWLYYASDMSGSSSRAPLSSRPDAGGIWDLNDIAPGSVGATLTLANGKTIKLSSATNGELAKEAGVTITKSADGQLIYEIASSRNASRNDEVVNTLSTAKGETYQVVLPDGSKVWLNAASSLTYSASLGAAGTRRVTLQGEAYFEIFKMTRPSLRGRTGASRSNLPERVPFIVATKNQEVEVLGTHFNINSYADERATKTTLLEGSVSISSLLRSTSSRGTEGTPGHATSRDPSMLRDDGKMPEATILKPGQQSTLTSTNRISVANVNISGAVDWKNGEFVADNADLGMIMRKIARWYNVDVVYTHEDLKSRTFDGSLSRYDNVSRILKTIEFAGTVKFKLEGRKITVSEK